MHGGSRVNVKVESRSTFTFTHGLSYTASISFTRVRMQKLRDSGNQPFIIYDGDTSEDGKKAIGLGWQDNNSARASRFFVHFCAVVTRLRRETVWRTGAPQHKLLKTSPTYDKLEGLE